MKSFADIRFIVIMLFLLMLLLVFVFMTFYPAKELKDTDEHWLN